MSRIRPSCQKKLAAVNNVLAKRRAGKGGPQNQNDGHQRGECTGMFIK